MDLTLFRQSITYGTIATTRSSTAAVVHVVHPRFDPPLTMNFATVAFALPPSVLALKAVIVSIARTEALVIGNRSGHVSSPVFRNFSQV